MVMEEDFLLFNQEEKQSSVNLDMPIAADNVTRPKQSTRLHTSVSAQGAGEKVEVLGTVQQNSSVVVVENPGYGSDEPQEKSNSNIQGERTMEHSNGALTARDANVTKEAMFTTEEGPVLVPGLFPLSDLKYEEVSGTITPVSVEVINEGKAETFPEVDNKQATKGKRNGKGKVKAVSLFGKSEQEAVKGVEKRHYNIAEEEIQQQQQQQQQLETEPLGTLHVVLEKDIQWGRRKLYKLLNNFGLL